MEFEIHIQVNDKGNNDEADRYGAFDTLPLVQKRNEYYQRKDRNYDVEHKIVRKELVHDLASHVAIIGLENSRGHDKGEHGYSPDPQRKNEIV